MQKVALFVDVTNQYYAMLNSHPGLFINYETYKARAIQGYSLYRAFAYGAQLTNEAVGFINVLRTLGYEPKYRPAAFYEGRADLRRTDRNMTLAMDVWRCIERTDVVVIGSSNPDLVPLVYRIKEIGAQAIIYSVNISRELRDAADRAIEVEMSVMEPKVPAGVEQ